jgi:hypothetical protein
VEFNVGVGCLKSEWGSYGCMGAKLPRYNGQDSLGQCTIPLKNILGFS